MRQISYFRRVLKLIAKIPYKEIDKKEGEMHGKPASGAGHNNISPL
jgi:hypothetical protein